MAYLERMLYGSKSDKLRVHEQDNNSGLFDDYFKEVHDEKIAQAEKVAKEIEQVAEKRRQNSKKTPNRPKTYLYQGLEERITTIYPEGVNMEEVDIIGKDVTRILHRQAEVFWVEVIERPICRHKSEKTALRPVIYQAPAPKNIIGGGHVGAELLSQIVIDKYQYHLPEYRQIKKFADLGVNISLSTLND